MMAQRPEMDFVDPASAHGALERVERVRALQRRMLDAAAESASGDSLWFVLSVRNRCEKDVHERLEAKNICSWMPVREVSLKRNRFRPPRMKTAPIFTGYVFVQVVPTAHAFAGLREIRDVESILGHGELPTPVPEENMLQINALHREGFFKDQPAYASDKRFRKGDVVAVSHGAFEFVEAVVEGYRGSRHVRCIANLFGGHVPINVPLDKIELV